MLHQAIYLYTSFRMVSTLWMIEKGLLGLVMTAWSKGQFLKTKKVCYDMHGGYWSIQGWKSS